VLFAALRPDYSHLTKAVSELGAVDAPNALGWNLLGFGAVGVLVVVFAGGMWAKRRWWLASLLVALSGIGFAATGTFQADMGDMNAQTTQLHILASLVSLGAFAVAIPTLGWTLWTTGQRRFAAGVIGFGVAAILSLGLRETSMPPGLAQRINFMAYLIWIAVVAIGQFRPRDSKVA
jgi:hypothetical membrane protein